MEIVKTVDADHLTIAPSGRLDTKTAPEFQAEVVPASKGMKTVDIDLANLEYISSAGLRALLALHKQCVANGCTMTIYNCNDMTSDVFRMTGFDQVLNFA